MAGNSEQSQGCLPPPPPKGPRHPHHTTPALWAHPAWHEVDPTCHRNLVKDKTQMARQTTPDHPVTTHSGAELGEVPCALCQLFRSLCPFSYYLLPGQSINMCPRGSLVLKLSKPLEGHKQGLSF